VKRRPDRRRVLINRAFPPRSSTRYLIKISASTLAIMLAFFIAFLADLHEDDDSCLAQEAASARAERRTLRG